MRREGLIINGLVFLMSFIGVFFFGFAISAAGQDCPDDMECAATSL